MRASYTRDYEVIITLVNLEVDLLLRADSPIEKTHAWPTGETRANIVGAYRRAIGFSGIHANGMDMGIDNTNYVFYLGVNRRRMLPHGRFVLRTYSHKNIWLVNK